MIELYISLISIGIIIACIPTLYFMLRDIIDYIRTSLEIRKDPYQITKK